MYRALALLASIALFSACGGGDKGTDADVVDTDDTQVIDTDDTDDTDVVDTDTDPTTPPVDADNDGVSVDDGDCDDGNAAVFPGAPEICDGIPDNDCDGQDDPQDLDVDGDGQTPCDGDCDDGDATIFDGAAESCDGLDNDCDGGVPGDEDDVDTDGYRLCDDDCDDGDPAVHPGAVELCDGIQNDCDAVWVAADEEDVDGDTVRVCDGDCDDDDRYNYPGNIEVCDGQDNNCDGLVDALDPSVQDFDGDGAGECDDCDDVNPFIGPGFPELCDRVDNSCDGLIDEGLPQIDVFPDRDGDGYGDPNGDTFSDCGPPGGYSLDDTDCDDRDPLHHPGAVERCDGDDDDCDGVVDDGCVGCAVIVPTDQPTVQDGIDSAAAFDLVCIEAGTYVENIDFGGKAVHLLGLSGAAQTTLDGGGVDSVVRFVTGEGADTILQGFTVTNGLADDGGGIHIYDASPILIDLVVSGNEANDLGGGLYGHFVGSSIARVDIVDNEASGFSADGGGGVLVGSSVALIDVVVDLNRAPNGDYGGLCLTGHGHSITDLSLNANSANGDAGGLNLAAWSSSVHGVVATNNSAGEDSGGLRVSSSSGGDFRDVTVQSNYATGDGGGLFLSSDGSVTFENLDVSNNTALGYGGGLFSESGAFSIDGLTLVGNSADRGGGASLRSGTFVTFRHATIAGNDSNDDGGGVHIWNSDASFDNVVFSANTTQAGHGAGLNVFSQAAPLLVTVDHTVFENNDAGLNGGGLHVIGADATVVVTNAMFADNAGVNAGGAYYHSGDVTLRNTTFVANTGDYGGAIHVNSGDLTVDNTIGVANTANFFGGAVYEWINPSAFAYNDFFGNQPEDVCCFGHWVAGVDGNRSEDPGLFDTSPLSPNDWDLHLAAASTLIDAGDPALLDPDGTVSDPGAFGGPGAATWDLDGDGFPAWWKPGPYVPGQGFDCDDRDALVFPGAGC